ncbi:MAG: tRNA dihydrouridine(20/20a) synthase DusA [Xanthomonadales bacterium]|jgi:tRNA-dihydrouridine synthase A|nr:tRNA dihydrouridine(20/20a) synthase DusA [Xanthomonadales bacterium]
MSTIGQSGESRGPERGRPAAGKKQRRTLDRRVSVAPMMDWTDRHCRYFHRLLSPSALLYTEMVTTGALLHGDLERHLAFNAEEHPVALQLGGSDPADLARCSAIAEEWGYDEVNLNVGCPSDRVQRGRFGACLMKEPELVRDCLAAMREAVAIPVTVKTRLGVDDLYDYDYFRRFVDTVREAGVDVFIAHARRAWLSGLSPKQNRDVPPLDHDWVYRLKRESPGLTVIINGGVDSLDAVGRHLEHVDGVMIGRAAYHAPWLLAECQAALLGGGGPDNPADLIAPMTAYLEDLVKKDVPIKYATRHVLGLFQGRPGAKVWRRYLSENAFRDDRNAGMLEAALAAMSRSQAA